MFLILLLIVSERVMHEYILHSRQLQMQAVVIIADSFECDRHVSL